MPDLPNLEDTNLPGIRVFRAPPDDFDPRMADGKTLLNLGLPVRPDATKMPDAAKAWDNVASQKLKYVTPNVTARPDLNLTPAGAVFHGIAGATIKLGGFFPVEGATGSWVVPSVRPASDGPIPVGGAAWTLLTSVGIAGATVADVLRAGTAQLVRRDENGLQINHLAWFAWGSSNIFVSDNLDIQAGDAFTATIGIKGNLQTATEATISFFNSSSGAFSCIHSTIPANADRHWTEVNWMVSQNFPNGVATPLPSFRRLAFTDCVAFACLNGTEQISAVAATPVDLIQGQRALVVANLNSDWDVTNLQGAPGNQ